MPYDKLVDSAQLDGAMTATADAIRAKTGGTAKIAWDATEGFKSAVSGIQAGGNYQSKTVTPKASSQTVKPDSGYDGLSQVTVNGDSDLKAANIAKGVNIFGVTGTMAKVATGTFTAPFMGGGVAVTVTGVGFTPSKIYIFEDLTEEGYRYDGYVAYLVGTASENFSAFPTTQEVYDEYDEEYYEYIAMETVKDEFTITMNSDGFKLATSRLNGYQFREGATCRYIAFA